MKDQRLLPVLLFGKTEPKLWLAAAPGTHSPVHNVASPLWQARGSPSQMTSKETVSCPLTCILMLQNVLFKKVFIQIFERSLGMDPGPDIMCHKLQGEQWTVHHSVYMQFDLTGCIMLMKYAEVCEGLFYSLKIN